MKKVIALMLLLAMVLGIAGCGNGEDKSDPAAFTKKTINLHVPFGVGGNLDLKARVVAKYLEKELGTPVVVVNKTGGSGVVGITEFLGKEASCNDLLYISEAQVCLIPQTSDVDYDIDSFEFLRGFDSVPGVLLANPKKSGISNFDEMIEYGKKNGIVFGGGGVSTQQYLLQRAIFNGAGIENEMLQHTNQQEGFTNVIGGHSQVVWGAKNMAKQYVESGDLVPICNFSDESWDDYAGFQVPSAKSLGQDLFFESFTFFATKKGAPEAEIQVIEDALEKVYNNAEFQAEIEKMHLNMKQTSREETTKLLHDMTSDITALVEKAK